MTALCQQEIFNLKICGCVTVMTITKPLPTPSPWEGIAQPLRFSALGIVVESPQRGTSEDLERKARAKGNAI
jgi:hypothetical protein